ncbi:hypothetical protein EI94DRAFT_746327 [Lactarius quietus]|nr:hypothetical protein EI94DRAFT_746327 [Lactarius quietus]
MADLRALGQDPRYAPTNSAHEHPACEEDGNRDVIQPLRRLRRPMRHSSPPPRNWPENGHLAEGRVQATLPRGHGERSATNHIGCGQFGAVDRAMNLNLEQMVAVKRIGPEGPQEGGI